MDWWLRSWWDQGVNNLNSVSLLFCFFYVLLVLVFERSNLCNRSEVVRTFSLLFSFFRRLMQSLWASICWVSRGESITWTPEPDPTPDIIMFAGGARPGTCYKPLTGPNLYLYMCVCFPDAAGSILGYFRILELYCVWSCRRMKQSDSCC